MSWIASSLWELLAGRKTSSRSPRSESAKSAAKKSTHTRKPMQEVVETRMKAFAQAGHAGDYQAKTLEEMKDYYK